MLSSGCHSGWNNYRLAVRGWGILFGLARNPQLQTPTHLPTKPCHKNMRSFFVESRFQIGWLDQLVYIVQPVPGTILVMKGMYVWIPTFQLICKSCQALYCSPVNPHIFWFSMSKHPLKPMTNFIRMPATMMILKSRAPNSNLRFWGARPEIIGIGVSGALGRD